MIGQLTQVGDHRVAALAGIRPRQQVSQLLVSLDPQMNRVRERRVNDREAEQEAFFGVI
jgi:hypothetical protein